MAEKKRAYHSPLREQQAERTREQICEAIVAQLYESGRSDFSFEDIAKRASVNVRTVYRYFPTREDLMNVAEQEWSKREPKVSAAHTLDDLERQTEQVFKFFEENHELLQAVATALGGQIEMRRRGKRTANLEALVAKEAPHLEQREVKRKAAMLRLIGGSTAYRFLRNEIGLTPEESLDAVKWAGSLLINDLKRRK